MFFTAVAFLVFITIMRFTFFYHFKSDSYTFSNSLNAFLLGLNFDTRIVCGIVLFPFLIGNLHLRYTPKRRLTWGSIAEVFFTIVIMGLLLLFMKKGHASGAMLALVGAIFSRSQPEAAPPAPVSAWARSARPAPALLAGRNAWRLSGLPR